MTGGFSARNFALAGLAVLAGLGVSYGLKTEEPADVSREAMARVKVPDLSASALEGKEEFEKNCASCHGANAAGRAGVAPPLIHKMYEPNHHGDPSFFAAAKNGMRADHWPFGDMPPVPEVRRDDVGLIVAYVRELQRANGIN